MLQIREEVGVTESRLIVRGKPVRRGKAKRADHILHVNANIPVSFLEAWRASPEEQHIGLDLLRGGEL